MTERDPGYSIHHGVFSPAEMTRALAAIERSGVARTRAGARNILRVPDIRALASDPRLLSLARHAIGDSAFPYRATLFDKSLAANWLVAWHQDTALPMARRSANPAWGPWTTKSGVLHAIAPASALEGILALRIHLDDSMTANGPLRVLPGTHRQGALSDADLDRVASAVDAVECTTGAGGVVAMRPLTVHASSKAQSDVPRRVIHVEYAASVPLDHDIELAIG